MGERFQYGLTMIVGALGGVYLLLNCIHKGYQILETRGKVKGKGGGTT